jgi:hypothetical protein
MLARVDVDQARLRPHLRRAKPRRVELEHTANGDAARAARAPHSNGRLPVDPVDPLGLRGIPVIGVAAGAIRGTAPVAALLAKERARAPASRPFGRA